MALTYSRNSSLKLGDLAPEFRLKGTDGQFHSLADFSNARALVVIFMCNHCPYVVAVQGRINALAKEYSPKGVSLIGINSNDSVRYPDDSFSAMQERAKEQGYVFPYLHDETQQVARAYDAVCTPDPYVFERSGSGFVLRYHGRIDDDWKDERAVTRRELALALDQILAGRPVSGEQHPAMGCSIKWRS